MSSSAESNLVRMFERQAAKYGDRDALYYKTSPGGAYRGVSWRHWQESVRATALGLYGLGVRGGDRIGLLSENRPEWTYADLGILSLGALTVPIYPTLNLEEVRFVVDNAGIEVLFVSTREQWERLCGLKEQCQSLHRIIVMDACPDLASEAISMEALMRKGAAAGLNNGELYEQCLSRVKREDLATIIYTSGTTGPPKGVMLTHANFLENSEGAGTYISVQENDIALSFLPLSHVFERLAGYYYMISRGAVIAYAENMKTVAGDMALVRPTVAAAVPRFYEKVYAGIEAAVSEAPVLRQKIFAWAKAAGLEAGALKRAGKSLGLALQLKSKLADWLVFGKIRKKLGGRLRFFISGGAPLNKELGEFFYAAGIMILEGYGLTETAPVIAVNSFERFRFGTVGQVLPNIKVKIAGDGEILTTGPCIMRGYYKREDATNEAIRDGWFYTGDIGHLDEDGFLHITDRKKDIIVTSGGKNIAPQNIEGLILADNLFLQAVVIGDKRNYLVALIVPAAEQVKAFAAKHGLSGGDYTALLQHPKIQDWVRERINRRTEGLAAYERIKYFALLEKELTLEAGQLTPTLKVKRKVIMKEFESLIESLYARGVSYQEDENKRDGSCL